ncbi:MAG: nitrogen regulation protein NR(I) [Gammaproteobacteria bacterium]
MNKHEVWVVDDDRAIRWVLETALSQPDMHITSFEAADAAIKRLGQETPNVIISDIRMPGIDGLSLLDHVNKLHPEVPVIIMTAHADLDRAVAAFQGGAFEYLPKPFDVDEAVAIVRRAVKHKPPDLTLLDPAPARMPGIIGEAQSMQEVFRAIGRLSRCNLTVLITGESGAGKELVARALHRHSPRSEKVFIALNTAAIPKELLESELFGHERGAFTGATSQRLGRFEQADGGTLFLDEIGDMPAELQTRLLRVLADGEFYRVGGHTPLKADVRVIAATHQNLQDQVTLGKFREDLFHRLNVIRLRLPPLRERKEDIRLLAEHFLARAAKELEVAPKILLPEATVRLRTFDWPGNVRQLENVCRWLTVMAAAQEIHLEDLPPELRTPKPALGNDWENNLRHWVDDRLAAGESELLTKIVPGLERVVIRAALAKTGGRRQEAAQLLGWGRNTLTRKIKELGIENA